MTANTWLLYTVTIYHIRPDLAFSMRLLIKKVSQPQSVGAHTPDKPAIWCGVYDICWCGTVRSDVIKHWGETLTYSSEILPRRQIFKKESRKLHEHYSGVFISTCINISARSLSSVRERQSPDWHLYWLRQVLQIKDDQPEVSPKPQVCHVIKRTKKETGKKSKKMNVSLRILTFTSM